MFDFLGRIAAEHPGKILLSWMLLAIGLTSVAPDWKAKSQDDDIRFLPPKYASVRGFQLMEQAFPKEVFASKVILAIERSDRALGPEDFRRVDHAVKRLEYLQSSEPRLQITGIASHRSGPVGKRLISPDQRCTLVQLALATPYLAVQTRETVDRIQAEIAPLFADAGSDPPRCFVTGPAGIGRDLVKASAESLDHTTIATILLVIVVLMAVYRSPLLALLPLLTIGLAVWVSLQILAIATLIPGVYIVNVSQVFAIVILFGAGTDYCLFLISRYREELESGHEPGRGITRAIHAVGGALAASAGTVICGLGMMGFAEFGKIRSAGPVIALGLAIGLLASLTLTPALLALGKRSVFWPQKVRLISSSVPKGFWALASQYIVRRPRLVLALSILPLIPFAILGTQIQPSFKPIGDLTPRAESVQGMEVLQDHFTAGETGPLTVLLASRTPWTTPESRRLLHEISQGFGHLQNVAEVRSVTQPLGEPLALQPRSTTNPETKSEPISLQKLWKRVQMTFDNTVRGYSRQAAEQHYLATIKDDSGPLYVTRLDVVMQSDPFDNASIATLEVIETWLQEFLPRQSQQIGSIRSECFGVTVHTRDMGRVITRDRLLVNLLVTVGVFLILLVLVRRIWMASYLLGTVLFSYFATLGLTALFAMWWTEKPFGIIEWRVPFFLFTILVAIGEDYNILLVTRILQEREKHGMIEGTRRGLAMTGGTITACGIIMAGTFGTLMLADLSTLKQIGFALAIGVMLDTMIVRPFLVPAFLLLVWDEPDSVAVRRRALRLHPADGSDPTLVRPPMRMAA